MDDLIRAVILVLFLGGCVTAPTPTQPVESQEIMSGEDQAIQLMKCTAFNLEYQVALNSNKQVVGISCIPKFGKTYKMKQNIVVDYEMSDADIEPEVTDQEVKSYIERYITPEMLKNGTK